MSIEELKSPTQYYWCVNCGHHGDYGKLRLRKQICENCEYDEITPLNYEEYQEGTNKGEPDEQLSRQVPETEELEGRKRPKYGLI